MKKPQRLRDSLLCCSKQNVGNSIMAAKFAEGVITGMVECLMAQGATYDRAWTIIKDHLPEHTSKFVLPKGWSLES